MVQCVEISVYAFPQASQALDPPPRYSPHTRAGPRVGLQPTVVGLRTGQKPGVAHGPGASSAHQPPAQGPGPHDSWGGAGVPVGTEQARQESACLSTKPSGDFTIDSASQTRRWGPPSQGGAVPGTDLTGKAHA